MQTLFILTLCLKNTYISLFILKTNIVITRVNIFVVINQINNHKAKIYNHCKYTQIIFLKNYLFSSQSIRMSGNSINFDNKKIKKVTYTIAKTKKYLI